ncbi:MAG: ribosome biogenesis GTP-binding protein YihA/YsxC [Fibrobacterota bacterium]
MGHSTSADIFSGNIEFVTSGVKPSHYPEPVIPDIAFAGRSNVGKSSCINSLCGRKKLVKTSSRPGHTKTVNFFNAAGVFFLADLPGVGYARAGKKVKQSMSAVLNDYFSKRDSIKAVVFLIDSRHGGTELDIQFKNFLDNSGQRVVIVATKCDKLNQKERSRSRQLIKNRFGKECDPVFFSALKKTGVDNLRNVIAEILYEYN